MDILRDLLEKTDRPPGYAVVRISNSAYVECVDFRVQRQVSMDALAQERQALIQEWIDSDDHVHVSKSFEHIGFSPNMAPLSVFPLEPRLCIDLLTGAKAYFVSLNVSAVAREFEHRGWEVVTNPREVLESGNTAEDFMTVRKEGFRVTVPPAIFMRLQMELLRPQVLIRQCELIRRAGSEAFNSEFNLPIYEHEADIWD